VTGYGTVQSAVQAMKNGAYDYVTKPFSLDELKLPLERVGSHLKLLSRRFMRDLRLIFFRYCAPLQNSYTFRVLICSCGRGVQKNTNDLLHGRY
jgi:DNA-binding response OmpR family regulator